MEELLQRLQSDNTAGATQLLELAIDILDNFADQPLSAYHGDFYDALAELARALIVAQPTMAVMINLTQYVLQACAGDVPTPVAQRQVRQALTTFRRQAHEAIEALCQHALAVLPSQATILTYSNSATVIAALHDAHAHGRVQRVILSESRPAYDGRLQAQALVERGIEVEYGIDMALFERVPEAQVVLVGADAVFPHGLVNKLGTHALMQLARHHGILAYSLCASNKFLPAAATALFHIADHPAQEVWSDAPAALRIRNRYFDTTPLALFSGIVSERGIHAPAALCQELQQQHLASALRRIAAGE